jgi:muramoyltetrapeptide carboxypeptidase LdcA involved in peptidoglycan recycling
MLPGTPYGNLPVFVADHCPEGVLLYMEVAESSALVAARLFHHVRLAGWLDAASAVLIGRTPGPDTAGFTQHDALLSAFGDLDVPVVYDVDVGHLPPQLALVNGALATLTVDPQTQSLRQRLV